MTVQTAALNLMISTTIGLGEIYIGTGLVAYNAPGWAEDILFKQTELAGQTGASHRAYCFMGASLAYDGFKRLAYIPATCIAVNLAYRSIRHLTQGGS